MARIAGNLAWRETAKRHQRQHQYGGAGKQRNRRKIGIEQRKMAKIGGISVMAKKMAMATGGIVAENGVSASAALRRRRAALALGNHGAARVT
jgi:hypothetical protein